ncbi:cysteine methyltransferase [Xylanimonas oleitrophica]|uniref:Cysteine methyltransferase n=1 Tax=Xylanimonas oleitrophica TaxID=2607479 RepID=A0A2W5WQP0_9MICO|nr:methylated-DNA--[protein]-cysteine S-methyltransferase [Xylanimonas oleitrophica]PZR53470.1 cysteine methyltransferase [Xylanimonas oleitrophica]
MTTVRSATLTTPDGPFTVVAGDDAVLASGWTDDVASLVALVHPVLRPVPATPDGAGAPAVTETSAGTVLANAVDAVGAYYDGDLTAPGRVPVRQRSGEFRELAWDVLRDVGPGEVVTYTQYAARAGRPAAVRAAAGACAMNAAALFVPCHRVLRTDGTLGGFRYGLAVKESLLVREAARGTTR